MTNIKLTPAQLPIYSERVILKLLFEHNGLAKFKETHDWDGFVSESLGISDEIKQTLAPKEIEDQLKIRLIEIEQYDRTSYENSVFETNLIQLKQLLDLSDCEIAIFRLAVYTKLNPALRKALNCFSGGITFFIPILSGLLNFAEKEIKLALKRKSKLFKYELLEAARYSSRDDLDDYLSYGGLLDFDDLQLFPIDKNVLLQQSLKYAPKPTLTTNDFNHLAEMRDKLQQHLQQSLATKKKGTNILIWGKPGSGKTELALFLSQNANAETYLLNYEDEDGETIKPNKRLNCCAIAQSLLSQQSAVIIFDEVEDVFCGGFFSRSVAQENKAWVNQLLENNNVPMIWLSNSVDSIDEAFLRRFDFVFEMPDMPFEKKATLMLQLSQQKLPLAYAQHFAKHHGISNALAHRAFAVLGHESEQCSPEEFAESVQSWFNQTLKAQGYAPLEKLNPYQTDYNLDWVNCNENLGQISQGLIRNKAGRICCYGPAGTGKTEWANWIAQQANCQVLVQRGSDLMGKYVGETEQNIAQAFRQAKENEMVLVLDEVDSFLFNRNGANHNWERSMVNEMLTQIERFDGLMVVSTNLMDSLDPAVLRRFDVKLKFDFLTQAQVCNVAKQHANKLGLTLQDTDFMQLENLKYLTLGDFAAVARRHRFAPFTQSTAWINALAQECELKGIKPPVRMGFM